MEMTQVRDARAVVERLNVARAAEACGVTRPALPKGIKALERAHCATPFFREGRRILLTEFGKTMVPHLRRIAGGAAAARAIAEGFRLLDRVPLRFGVPETVGHLRRPVPVGLRGTARRHRTGWSAPPVSTGNQHRQSAPAVSTGSRAALLDDPGRGEIDLAILSRGGAGEERFNLLDLCRERSVVVFPPGHRPGALNAVPLAELSGERHVDRLACEMREMVMAVCETEGVEPCARFRSEREDWVQAMVLAGIGFAFMPEYSVTLPGLIQRPLIAPAPHRGVALARARGRTRAPGTAALIGAARSFRWPG